MMLAKCSGFSDKSPFLSPGLQVECGLTTALYLLMFWVFILFCFVLKHGNMV